MGSLRKYHQDRKHWKDLTKAQQARVLSLGALQIALQTAAIKDITKRPAYQIKGPKAAWIAGTFINFIGPIAYFVFGRRKA
ncbi:hypothetical protein GCM10023081_31190 [Arthrobacter ginkgonis]|jgi:hypothetical protein|uniref:Cardiolipin synthase N-terminal domain-containing protein n=1 Tax=Arthrobacter ginkgonis TaxID=1630594 RepID=A0ABP7CMW9_9MICC